MKVRILFVCIGIALGFLAAAFFFKPANDNIALPDVSQSSSAELKENARQLEISYSKSYDSLKQRSISLVQELDKSKSALTNAKAKNALLQKEVIQLIQNRDVEPMSTYEKRDSSCDSLVVAVEYLMKSSAEKDSLYEHQLSQVDSVISVKDAIAEESRKAYNDLRNLFDKAIDNEKIIASEYKELQNRLRRQKFKSKFVSAVVFTLSGIIVNHLLRR